ncbi:MAG TPA: pantoate--beta-alanine ligase [Thermoanaerobaculia bacterium]|nr:pantoate--beta-alanine ligase [Thermoanaerobaculia bacterium]
MLVTASIPELRSALAPLRARGPVGLVPTMGALHEGHLSLVRIARKEAATVVVSIFVNPLQFGPAEDLAKYPRTLEADLALLEREGVEAVFTPAASEFYPAGFSTTIQVANVSEGEEGAVRPGHFVGVATVVAKLFHVVGPDVAVFGRKDLQQAAVVRRMIDDLDFPIRLIVAPISREKDGLARSSRNVYLSFDERRRAAGFPRALFSAAERIAAGEAVGSAEERARRELEGAGFEVDYAEVVDPATMRRTAEPRPGAALAAAVRLGKIRLLDNVLLEGQR